MQTHDALLQWARQLYERVRVAGPQDGDFKAMVMGIVAAAGDLIDSAGSEVRERFAEVYLECAGFRVIRRLASGEDEAWEVERNGAQREIWVDRRGETRWAEEEAFDLVTWSGRSWSLSNLRGLLVILAIRILESEYFETLTAFGRLNVEMREAAEEACPQEWKQEFRRRTAAVFGLP